MYTIKTAPIASVTMIDICLERQDVSRSSTDALHVKGDKENV